MILKTCARTGVLRSTLLIRQPAVTRFGSFLLASSPRKFYSTAGGRIESNAQTETNRVERTLEKFWTKVNVKPSDNGQYVVTLDTSPVKTPKGNQLVVPNPTLAHILAQEWSVITSLNIKPHSLPLTSLAARAIDINNSEVDRDTITDYLMPYLDTDTLLVFAPSTDCEGALRIAQEDKFRPIINRAEDFWNIRLKWLDGDTMLFGNSQSEEAKQVVRNWIESLDNFELAVLERATMTAKSLIAGLLILTRSHSIDEISDLVNLEIIHQAKVWGEVEDSHDVNHADIRRHLGSCYVFSSANNKK